MPESVTPKRTPAEAEMPTTAKTYHGGGPLTIQPMLPPFTVAVIQRCSSRSGAPADEWQEADRPQQSDNDQIE
jgi:hypothetical protein